MEEVDSGNNISLGGSPASDPPFPRNILFFMGKVPTVYALGWSYYSLYTGKTEIKQLDFCISGLGILLFSH